MPLGLSRIARSAVGAAGLLLLPACGATSSPVVTAFSGTTSQSVEAQCWRADRAVSGGDCDLDGRELGRLEVRPGQTIGISVPKLVAAKGWVAMIGNTPLTPAPVTETYYRFAVSEGDLRGGALQLQVRAETGEDRRTRGVWLFELARH